MTSNFLRSLVDARLDDALLRAADGRPLIVRARRPGTAESLIERAVRGPAILDPVRVEVLPDRSPQSVLIEAASAIAPDTIDLSTLCASPHLHYKLLTVDLRERDAAPWLMLAGTFASQRAKAEEGPALALITDNVSVPVGCDMLDDGAFVGPPEAAVFTRELRPKPSLIAECADAVAIEVSRGDLTQLQAMLDLNERERFDPSAWVGAQPLADTKLPWRGEEEVCSTWLARNNPKRLRHRVWRGQVSVLFPWLAESLRTFLETHRQKLPRDLIDQWTNIAIPPDEFEWNDILYIFNRERIPQADSVFRLRKLRNALAHQDPLSWLDANRAQADFQAVMGWRR